MIDKIFKIVMIICAILFICLFYIQTKNFLILYNKRVSVEFLKFSHDYIFKEFHMSWLEREHLLQTGFILLDQTLTYDPALHVSLNEKDLNRYREHRS